MPHAAGGDIFGHSHLGAISPEHLSVLQVEVGACPRNRGKSIVRRCATVELPDQCAKPVKPSECLVAAVLESNLPVQ